MKNVYSAQGTGSSSQFITYFKIWNSDTAIFFSKQTREWNGDLFHWFRKWWRQRNARVIGKSFTFVLAGNMKAGWPLRGKMDDIYWCRCFCCYCCCFCFIIVAVGYSFLVCCGYGEKDVVIIAYALLRLSVFSNMCQKTNNIIGNYGHFSYFCVSSLVFLNSKTK